MTRLPLALVALALIFPATASAKACTTNVPNTGNLTAKNVSCKTARKVMKAHLAGDATPLGYTCKQRQFEGGVTNTCRKGDKRVRYSLAD
jgi:hypothetical protein